MLDVRIAEWLDELADRKPTPGGGAVAALCAASSAALLEMVGNYTTGKKWADREEAMRRSSRRPARCGRGPGRLGRGRHRGVRRRRHSICPAQGDRRGEGGASAAIQRRRSVPRSRRCRSGRRDPAGGARRRAGQSGEPERLCPTSGSRRSRREPRSAARLSTHHRHAALLRDADAARGLLDEAAELERVMARADEVAARVVERLKA